MSDQIISRPNTVCGNANCDRRECRDWHMANAERAHANVSMSPAQANTNRLQAYIDAVASQRDSQLEFATPALRLMLMTDINRTYGAIVDRSTYDSHYQAYSCHGLRDRVRAMLNRDGDMMVNLLTERYSLAPNSLAEMFRSHIQQHPVFMADRGPAYGHYGGHGLRCPACTRAESSEYDTGILTLAYDMAHKQVKLMCDNGYCSLSGHFYPVDLEVSATY